MEIIKEEENNRHRTELGKLSALLEKYLQGTCTAEEQQAIEEWYESLSGERETMPSEELSAKKRIWAGIRLVGQGRSQEPEKVLVPQPRQWLGWAASVAILSLSSVLLYKYMPEQQLPSMFADISEQHWTMQRNSNPSEMKVFLPDSSRITLKPDAMVGYPKTFNETERLVKLDGEAFFEIKKDAQRPFKVITGEITTRVLGTSFNVKAIGKQSIIEVDVRTGRVSVYEHNHTGSTTNTEGVVLTPNQKVTYYKNEKKWVAELVSDPLPIEADADEASKLVFRDDQLRNVLQRIASLYSIEIIVVNEAIYDCPFTGDVSQMELYDMLNLICKSIRSKFEVRGTRILIDGVGCP